nr:hypothetical protein MACL_00003504 [Theileria orientalis]
MIVVAIGKSTTFKVLEKFLSNYEMQFHEFFTAFSLSGIFIPLYKLDEHICLRFLHRSFWIPSFPLIMSVFLKL